MAGNAIYESTSGSPEPGVSGSYPNGQRGNYPGPNLDRSGSFREGGESRMFGSGYSIARTSATLVGDPSLSQCLMLEPITMGDQKYTRSGELRRVLGISMGNASEDNSYGAGYPKPASLVPMDEIKRYKASVIDGCHKARGRAKKFDEHLLKLNKLSEAVNSKKQQRVELLTHERSSIANLKMTTQIHQNPSDIVTRRMEDRAKNVFLNKRIRTSLAEPRAECRNNGLPRQSPVVAKDRNMLKDSGSGSDLVEDKIRKLPAGGEGWDRKMKRKRSVGTVSTRPIESDGDLKRAMHHKLSNEPSAQSCDPRNFRSGSSNGASALSKLDKSSSVGIDARKMAKNEQDKVALTKDLRAGMNKERFLAKGSTKFNNREESHVLCPSPVTKGKASRAPRTGSMMAANSSPSIPRVLGVLESWEHSPSGNKISSVGGADNRKRPVASGTSSPPVTQWVGQRPQKISRTRRANLVSPVSNHDDSQMSSEGCSPSDFGGGETSSETNGSFISRSSTNVMQQFKVKLENASSPARLSEFDESAAGENMLKDKGVAGIEVEEKAVNAQNVETLQVLTKKKQVKEDMGNGVRRQGRSGRGPAFSKGSSSPVRERLESAIFTKPLRSTRPGSDKVGSKSGRPLKKQSERKGFSHLVHTASNGSPDLTGESEDDHEELLEVAKFACNASYVACSSLFWKKMEPFFAHVSPQSKSYLSQQLKLTEELHEHLSQMFSHGNDILVDPFDGKNSVSDTLFGGEKNRTPKNQNNSMKSAGTLELADQPRDLDTSCEKLDWEKSFKRSTPLYQRVLSALIAEDEIEECEDNGMDGSFLSQHETDDFHYDTCYPVDIDLGKMDSMPSECEAVSGIRIQKQSTSNKYFSCNGSITSNRSLSIQNPPCNGELIPGDARYLHSEVGVSNCPLRNDLSGPKIVQANGLGLFSSDCQYDELCVDEKLLLELQSVGLYLEKVPDLYDGEDEVINEEIAQLKKDLYQQIDKKKTCLDRICKAIHDGKDAERRYIESVAMNRLVEVAYKKLLATRGTSASRSGVPKVSKQVALAFAKRSIARCRKFEDSGTTCFSEPALHDVIFGMPPQGSISGDVQSTGLHSKIDKVFSDKSESAYNQSDRAFPKGGPVLSRGKKKEIFLEDVGGGIAMRAPSPLGCSVLGGTKGKRSERERDNDAPIKSAIGRASRSSMGNVKGERKTKSKPKQKTSHPSASGNEFHSTSLAHSSGEFVTNSGIKKREVGSMCPGNVPQEPSKEIPKPVDLANMQLHDLDSIDELDVGTGLGGPQDLSSWLTFDEDGLQDHDSVGLEIPMDDISELNMF